MRARALLGVMGSRKQSQKQRGETTSGSPPCPHVASRTTMGAAVAPTVEKRLVDHDETPDVNDTPDLTGHTQQSGDEDTRSNGGYKGTPGGYHATDLKEAYSAEGTRMTAKERSPAGDDAADAGGEGMGTGTEAAAAPSGVVIRDLSLGRTLLSCTCEYFRRLQPVRWDVYCTLCCGLLGKSHVSIRYSCGWRILLGAI